MHLEDRIGHDANYGREVEKPVKVVDEAGEEAEIEAIFVSGRRLRSLDEAADAPDGRKHEE